MDETDNRENQYTELSVLMGEVQNLREHIAEAFMHTSEGQVKLL